LDVSNHQTTPPWVHFTVKQFTSNLTIVSNNTGKFSTQDSGYKN
ncbi:7193_t:CDS:1, partial [Gigaspora rosea]